MDIPALLAAAGFEPMLAAQAAGSFPLYIGTFAVVKRWEAIPERFNMLVAAFLTAVVNVAAALGGGTAPVLPALSAAAVGAWLAMIAHSFLFKGREERVAKKRAHRDTVIREHASKPLSALDDVITSPKPFERVKKK